MEGRERLLWGGGLLLAAVIVLALCLFSHLGAPGRALEGFWSADSGFLGRAGLRSMHLYLGAPEAGEYPGYLVMATDAGLVCNQAVTLWPGLGPGVWRRDAYRGAGVLELSEPGAAPAALAEAAPRLEVVVSPREGSLVLGDGGGVVLGSFFKDHAASLAADAAAPGPDALLDPEEEA